MPLAIVDAATGTHHTHPANVVTQPAAADKERLAIGDPVSPSGAFAEDGAVTLRANAGGQRKVGLQVQRLRLVNLQPLTTVKLRGRRGSPRVGPVRPHHGQAGVQQGGLGALRHCGHQHQLVRRGGAGVQCSRKHGGRHVAGGDAIRPVMFQHSHRAHRIVDHG